jgi:cytochrome c-type biogenesis protein CcmE
VTRLYVQWTVITIAATIVVVAVVRYYERHLTTVTPDAVLAGAVEPGGVVRVQGQVAGGTLTGDLGTGQATFQFRGERAELPVQYIGPPPENLRELKTLVVVGRWDSEAGVFLAQDLALATNYGFVVGAYLAGFFPLAVFVFAMERRVRLLYAEIKHAKLYEPESPVHVDPR